MGELKLILSTYSKARSFERIERWKLFKEKKRKSKSKILF